MSVHDIEQKDEHGCLRGKQKWDGTKCVAVEPKESVATEPDTKKPELEIQGKPQSVEDKGPTVTNHHKRRTHYRAPISTPAAVKQFQTPTRQGQVVEHKKIINFIKSKRTLGYESLKKKKESG